MIIAEVLDRACCPGIRASGLECDYSSAGRLLFRTDSSALLLLFYIGMTLWQCTLFLVVVDVVEAVAWVELLTCLGIHHCQLLWARRAAGISQERTSEDSFYLSFILYLQIIHIFDIQHFYFCGLISILRNLCLSPKGSFVPFIQQYCTNIERSAFGVYLRDIES